MRRRVAVLRALGLGDLLTGVPALRALRRAFPEHEVVLAAPADLAGAVAACGAVDRLLPAAAPGRGVPEIPWTGPPPQVAVDLHGNGPASHDAVRRLGAEVVMGFAHPDSPWLHGPPWLPDEHERARWCRMLGWYGIAADPDDLRLPAPAGGSAAPGAVLLHPGAGAPARMWPAERFAAVARALHAAGLGTVITAGPGEAALAHRVADLARPADPLVVTEPSYEELAALVAEARAVVAGDTGPAHLAAALGTPSVVLCGPVAPALWGPPRDVRHRALWHAPAGGPLRPGDANGPEPDVRLLRITPQDVLGALREIAGHAGPVLARAGEVATHDQ